MADDIEDAILRQQIYIEAVKENESGQLASLMDEVTKFMAGALASVEGDTFGTMSRTKFNALMRKLKAFLGKATKASSNRALQRLYNFMKGDFTVSKYIFRKRYPDEDKPDEDAAQLWALVNDNIVPAFGETVPETYSNFFVSAIVNIGRMVATAYADNRSTGSLIREFTGTAANGYRDGLAHRLQTQFDSVVRTAMQWVANQVHNTIAQLYFNTYQWISILDSSTTKICRSRANHIYTYGEGPMPPAHYGCRSRTIPVANLSRVAPETFLQWIRTQSTDFQNFALGISTAQDLRRDGLTVEQYPRFVNRRSLTTSQYVAAASSINTP